MQKQRSIGGAEGRERAKTRATADMVALDIRKMYFSFNHFASFFQVEDVHSQIVCILSDQVGINTLERALSLRDVRHRYRKLCFGSFDVCP